MLWQFGRYEAFMTYTFLSLFFITMFKWNKHYYVRTSCCNTVYEIPKEIGERIAKGEHVELQESDLILVRGQRSYKHCPKCGFTTGEEFVYCPKCGERLE